MAMWALSLDRYCIEISLYFPLLPLNYFLVRIKWDFTSNLWLPTLIWHSVVTSIMFKFFIPRILPQADMLIPASYYSTIYYLLEDNYCVYFKFLIYSFWFCIGCSLFTFFLGCAINYLIASPVTFLP